MKTIDAAAVNALLDYPALLDALEAGHRTGVDEAERLLLEALRPAPPITS